MGGQRGQGQDRHSLMEILEVSSGPGCTSWNLSVLPGSWTLSCSPSRAAGRSLRALCKVPLREALSAAGGEPNCPPRAPSATHPPPPCLCEVTPLPPEISRSSALYRPVHNQGKPGRPWGLGRWKTKRENKGTAPRRPKGRVPPPSDA